MMDTALEEREESLHVEISALAHSRNEEQKQKAKVDYWEGELAIYLAAYPDAKQLEEAKEVHGNLVENTNTIVVNVREKTLGVYKILGHKNVYDGVSVAEYTTFEIDQDLAIAWASEHHQKALKLNLTEIKKVAKAGMEVHGVILGKENRAKIASDLSSYLVSDE